MLGRSTEFGGWVGPFVMAEYNTRVVRRSECALELGVRSEFSYREVSSFGNGPLAPAVALGMGIGMKTAWIGMGIKPIRAIL